MNIYLVELLEEDGSMAFEYDTYDSFVVSAKNKPKAYEVIKGKDQGFSTDIPKHEKVKITKLGEYYKDVSEIILGSFNAG